MIPKKASNANSKANPADGVRKMPKIEHQGNALMADRQNSLEAPNSDRVLTHPPENLGRPTTPAGALAADDFDGEALARHDSSQKDDGPNEDGIASS